MSADTDTLESMCELVIDCPHFTPKWTDSGYIVLRNQNIKNGVLNLSSPSFTHKEDFKRRNKRATPKAGDIVFTREAPMGEVCMIPDGLECCLGQRQVLLRPKNDVCGQYLFWALQSPFVQHQISWNEGTGSTVSNVRIPVLKALNIPRHPKKEAEIAKLLSDLADKIELNRQTNQTLEEMAQAVFKSWFVDFEPTRAKITAKENGQDPERAAMAAIAGKAVDELNSLPPEQFETLKSTAALFPDALTDSELGQIPEGWEVKELRALTSKISKGTTPRKADMQAAKDSEIIPFLKVRDISDDGEIRRIDLDRVPNSIHSGALKRSILEKNDLLFSIAGTIGRVALVEKDLSNSNCNQAIAFIRLKEQEKHIEITRLNLVGNRVQDEVLSKVVQGVQANFSLAGIGEIKILIPFEELLAAFNVNIGTISSKQRLLLSENRKLSELRDTLLPKLLSGEIDLSEQEKAVVNG